MTLEVSRGRGGSPLTEILQLADDCVGIRDALLFTVISTAYKCVQTL